MNAICFSSTSFKTKEEREKWLNDYLSTLDVFKGPTSLPVAKASGGRIGGSNWGA
jgi:hypothetical protein